MVGVESAYSYAGSPLIADEPGNVAEWETSSYVPHARPGVRIPHMWLKDGRAMQDVLGDDYTLLDLRGDCDAAPLVPAFRALGAPLEVLHLDEARVRRRLRRVGVPAATGPAYRLARRWTAPGTQIGPSRIDHGHRTRVPDRA